MTVVIGSDSNDLIIGIKKLLNSKITALSCLYNGIPELALIHPTAIIIVDIHSNGSMSECYGCNILKILHEQNLNNPVLLLSWLTRKYILHYTSNNTTQNPWLFNSYDKTYRICQLPVNSNELNQIINELKPFQYE
jgi:hypothetical protein